MALYARQIVAISKTSSPYFAHGNFRFSNISCTFAYVLSKPLTCFGGIGYHLNALNEPKTIQCASIVNENTLAECTGSLELRLASIEELKKIRVAVISLSAVFSTLFCIEVPAETMAILDTTNRIWCSIV